MHSIARNEDNSGNDKGLELLLALKEQICRIEEQLGRLVGGAKAPPDLYEGRLFKFDDSQGDGSVELGVNGKRTRTSRPALPDPRLLRLLIRQRRARARFFDENLFADPAWDILLDLAAAREEHVRVSVTSLCIASGVPTTTALRWIAQMCEAGLLRRDNDEIDRRRAFVSLTDAAANAMARFFAENSVVRTV